MTKKTTILLITTSLLLASLLLAACGGNQPVATEDPASQEDQINMIYTQAAETLSAEIAMTEAAQPTATNTLAPTPTSALIVTNTLAPTEESTPFPTLPSLPTPTTAATKPPTTGGRPCLRAEIAFESPTDGIVMSPENSFVRYWNFTNSGSCTWTEEFSLVHVGGPNFTDSEVLSLDDYSNITTDGLPNGGLLKMSISMEAPKSPGTYRSYWMLRDNNGQIFGVGPLGDEVMWVEIVVSK